MPRLIAALMRHGDYEQPVATPSAWLPHPLTERGEAQARAAAAELLAELEAEGLALDPVVECSTLQRAWQTARIVAAELQRALSRQVTVQEHSELVERGVGSAANLTIDEIAAVLRRDPRFGEPPPDWKTSADYRLPFPGAESLSDAGRRCAKRLEASLAEVGACAGRDTLRLFVGHGGAFRFAAVHLGVLAADEAPARSMYHCGRVWIERLGDGSWRHVAGAWKVRRPDAIPAD